MLYLGCPLWANAKWKASLYSPDAKPNQYLQQYASAFNSAEGNTTFYADPSDEALKRWYQDTPAQFRFMLKVPQRISHQPAADNLQQLELWLARMQQLAEKLSLVHLQLPARSGPQQLTQIANLIECINRFNLRCALEVRHLAFFDKAQHEISLHRLLQQLDAERVVFDSRALFSVAASSTALQDAQSKKPRLPVHAISFSDTPVLRFIGCDDLAINRQMYQPWLGKVQQWLKQGKQPYLFFHTPDNHFAPQLCRQFVSDLQLDHQCLASWPGEQQISLL